MFMKKYIILSLLCIGLGGCNSWLDVTSDQEVYEESMFEESRGYYTALNGLYILMSEGTLYGANLSYGAMEAWSRSYDLDNNNLTTFLDLANLKYENSGPKSLGESQLYLRLPLTLNDDQHFDLNKRENPGTQTPYQTVLPTLSPSPTL